ncbi:hypothetical protein LTR09_012468 [Extremus antarcticus]|uniref:Uncharacterized protein n=1 Tax=Extremus antarcticus TaxID=702011 RepID=A0AAJ0D9T5_9PEZI|nr:hypothetical protein LTR09_012468 [Extremus antarcticus]
MCHLSKLDLVNTAGSRDIPENAIWESTPLPQQQSPLTVEPERAKYPPFNPQDYINMRKQNPQSYDVGMEIKVRELEDSSMFSRNQPPSVKAWKFGRSVRRHDRDILKAGVPFARVRMLVEHRGDRKFQLNTVELLDAASIHP